MNFSPADDFSYDEATRNTWPILSVYMPVASARRKRAISGVYTSLNCSRPDKFTEGSRVSSGGIRANGSIGAVAGALAAVILLMTLV